MPTEELIDFELKTKIKSVLQHLASSPTNSINDDTVLQKLKSQLEKFIQNEAYTWQNNYELGVIDFVSTVLESSYLQNNNNIEVCSLALYITSMLLSKEDNFNYVRECEFLDKTLDMIPFVKNSMSLYSALLDVIKSLLTYSVGQHWCMETDIWTRVLLPTLDCSSVFVKKGGRLLMVDYLILIKDKEEFQTCIADLILLKDDSPDERIFCNSILRRPELLNILMDLHGKTMGDNMIYDRIAAVVELEPQLTYLLEYFDHNNEEELTKICNLFMLIYLHRFSKSIDLVKFHDVKELSSLKSDILSLADAAYKYRKVVFFFNSLHKSWKYIKDLSKYVTELQQDKFLKGIEIFMLYIQVMPMYVYHQLRSTRQLTYSHYMDVLLRDAGTYTQHWNSFENIDDDPLTNLYIEHFKQNQIDPLVICIRTSTSGFDWDSDCKSQDYKAFTSCVLLSLLENFCQKPLSLSLIINPLLMTMAYSRNNFYMIKVPFSERCVLTLLCDLIPHYHDGSNRQHTFKWMMKVLPIYLKRETLTEEERTACFSSIANLLQKYISDTEWEIRDSVLEVILTLTSLGKEHPFLVDWLITTKLLDAVMLAVGDSESYVQASALAVLAKAVVLDKLWEQISDIRLMEQGVAIAVKDGSVSLRREAILLMTNIYEANRNIEGEVSSCLPAVIQHSTQDPDHDIRLPAVKFIRAVINKQLLDKASPYSVVTPSQPELLDALIRLCSNGYFTAVIDRMNDTSDEVSNVACSIMQDIKKAVIKYDLREPLLSHQSTQSGDTVKETGPSPTCGTESQASSIEQSEDVISDILKSSDMSQIVKLKRQDTDVIFTTSYITTILPKDLIPDALAPVTTKFLVDCLDNLDSTVCNNEKVNNFEFLCLLDDILVDTNTSKAYSDDHKARDCY